MNLNFFGTNKIFYVLAGIIIFLILISLVFILGKSGGGGVQDAKINFWGAYDTRQDVSEVIKAFEGANSGVKITYTQFAYEDYERALVDALAAGTGPDVFMIHHTWLAGHKNKLSPIPTTSSVKDYKFMTPTDFQGQFVEVVNKDLISDGKIYAMPLYVDTLALFYNRDMFNTAGITHPPKSWDEFNEDVKLLTKFDNSGNIVQAGAAMGTAKNINRSTDILSALMIQNGTKMNNTTNTAATFTRSVSTVKVGENALQYYTDFANPLKEVYTWNDSQHYSLDAFTEGGVAMMFNYSHQIPIIQKRFSRLNFAVAPMPQFSELDAKTYANYWAVGVSAKSKYQEAAWMFTSYLGSREGSSIYLSSTARPAARRDVIDVQRNDSKLGVFAVQALTAKSWYQIDNNAVDQIFADMIDNVNLKRQKLRAAMQAAESAINTLTSRRP